jgi:hypothetical protein
MISDSDRVGTEVTFGWKHGAREHQVSRETEADPTKIASASSFEAIIPIHIPLVLVSCAFPLSSCFLVLCCWTSAWSPCLMRKMSYIRVDDRATCLCLSCISTQYSVILASDSAVPQHISSVGPRTPAAASVQREKAYPLRIAPEGSFSSVAVQGLVLSAVPVEGMAPTREAYENPKAFWRSAILRVAMGGGWRTWRWRSRWRKSRSCLWLWVVRFDGAVALFLLLMRFGKGGWELLSDMLSE